MQLRNLGDTGLSVTPVGLGLAALGRPGYINLGHADDLDRNYNVAEMERRTHNVLDEAWKLGVRYFDAARSYGKAEEFLSSWLRNRTIASGEATIGSKWGYSYTAGWKTNAEKHEVKEHTLPVLQKQWTESRDLLGEYLDLYQIHSATLESGVLENKDVLNELARLKERGIRIGLSLSGEKQAKTLDQAIRIRIDGRRLFDTVQATWNLLEPSASASLPAAHSAGMGVIIKEAVANGRLTNRNTEPEFKAKRTLLENIASKNNCTIDAVAIAAALSNSWVDVVLSGAATLAHLRDNLKAVEFRLEPAELEEIVTKIKEPPEAYWSRRKSLEWN